MLISYRWLARHVDLSNISAEQLGDDLTLSTAEVEGIEPFAPHLEDVVVGHVTQRVPHPDADKLSVCTVDAGAAGDGTPLTIVCGAPNVDAGQNIALARVGCVLPGDFKIKKSKIRGVESRGMICSLKELELGDDHSGIWVLPAQAPVGEAVASALDMRDWVIEIDNKSLTHRPDLWGHRGIAREVAAIYERPLLPLDLSLPETGDAAPFPIAIESDRCPRYTGLAIDGARALPSPAWLRNLLLAVGQRPFDQLVDLSNFVMLDLGQPNHTFDRSRLSAEGIVVRQARQGETIQTLDGEERKLLETDLLICSGDEPVALAGIMGGEGSKVGEDTSELLLEVATFAPATVRRTSSRLGLRTDASARFEKSLDPTLPADAAAHYARLLSELQPEVRFPAPLSDAGQWQDPAHVLELRPAAVHTALGKTLPDGELTSILTRLGFGVEAAGELLRVSVPSRRATKDVTIERDLIEEIGRLHRYGNLPERTLLAEVTPFQADPRRALVRRIQDRLAGAARFHETLSYSFMDVGWLERTGLDAGPWVTLANPGIEGLSRVRRAVLPSLFVGLERARRQRGDVRLFEVGKGYLPEHAGEDGQPREVHQLALVWAGTPPGKKARWDEPRLHRLHAVLEDLFASLELAAPCWGPLAGEQPGEQAGEQDGETPIWSHPARGFRAHWAGQDAPAATVAELDPRLARDLGLAGELASDVAVAEISIDALLVAPPRPPSYRALPRYPGLELDVAAALDAGSSAASVDEAIRKAGKGLVQDVSLFDVYAGPNLGAGKKSLAFHVLLQSDTRTLTDKDGSKFLGRLEKGLSALGGELRKG